MESRVFYQRLFVALVFLLALFPGFRESGAEVKEMNVIDLIGRGEQKTLAALSDELTWKADGRWSPVELYRRGLVLRDRFGWLMEEIFHGRMELEGGKKVILPALCFRTQAKGPALWIITGIHGEEPAGPMALCESSEFFGELGIEGIPMVIFPLCNPEGYCKSWRYPDAARASEKNPGSSVGDSEHLLFDDAGRPRRPGPSSLECDALTGKVLELARDYPPLLTLDFHEDDQLERGYLYSSGRAGAHNPVAARIVRLFREQGYPLYSDGTTRFGEVIRNGIIADVKDGSIDELLSARRIFLQNHPAAGPSSWISVVIETSSINTPVEKRAAIHRHIMKLSGELWKLAGAGGK